ncbi:MAG: hypothetical protein IPM29_08925 [Planctomycetes bacterium]|nr:hypothetical protein [Planctomycetota bacterium]
MKWLSLFPVLLLALGSCGPRRHLVIVDPLEPARVEIEVEVYDPVTGGVWENVGVRIVEAYNEWSGCICPTTRPDLFLLSDRNGLAYFSPQLIAEFDVGFAEDGLGNALLGYQSDRDEAVVRIEVFAVGFRSVFVDVPLTWDEPYRFVSVPFE